jgi:outer membrane murein-binding lipoprotein Lpp
MPIRRERQQGRAVGLVIVLAALLGGCDYWPPALQTQIEQLRSELQTLTMEKAQLQTQVTSLTKAKCKLTTSHGQIGTKVRWSPVCSTV